MSRSLNLHPDVASFGETEFWGLSFVQPDSEGHYDRVALDRVAEVMSSKPLSTTIGGDGEGWMTRIHREDTPGIVREALGALDPPVTPGETFVALARAIARAEDRPHWIEKTPHHLNWVDRILHDLPDARFVIMLRDPYAFLLSYKHQQDRGPAERRRRFARRYHPLGGALVWRASLRTALRLEREFPDQVLLVRLEDIASEPGAVLTRVQEFLLLDAVAGFGGIANRENSAFDGEERPELAGAEIMWLNRVAGSEMRAAGYRPRAARGDVVGALRSIAALPAWGLRVRKDIRERGEGSFLRYVARWLFPRAKGAGESLE